MSFYNTYPTPSTASTSSWPTLGDTQCQISSPFDTLAPSMSDPVSFGFGLPSIDTPAHQHAEITTIMVLFLWNQIPIDKLMLCWSSFSVPTPMPTRPTENGFNITRAAITTFRSFVEHVLSTTRVSSAVIVLALKYLDRIKDSRNLLPADSPLRRPDSEQLVLLVSLMLANKFADDERFTNSAWASVADVDLAIVNRAEMDALEAIRWKLTVDERDYTKWVETVTSHAHLAVQTWEAVEEQKRLEQASLRMQIPTSQVTVPRLPFLAPSSEPRPYIYARSEHAAYTTFSSYPRKISEEFWSQQPFAPSAAIPASMYAGVYVPSPMLMGH